MRKKINKYDIALIAGIIIVNCFLIYYFSNIIIHPANSIAQVYSEGKLVGEYKLKTGYSNEFKVVTKDGKGYNIIKIKDNDIWVDDANCPDLNCKHQGHIKSEGQIIACLPNNMYIKIIGNGNNNNDDIDIYAQ